MAALSTEQLRIFFGSGDQHIAFAELTWPGNTSQVSLDFREVVFEALSRNASAIILAHNHPSGDPQPSKSDIAFTRRIYSVCKALAISVTDHIIVAKRGACSFRNEGYL